MKAYRIGTWWMINEWECGNCGEEFKTEQEAEECCTAQSGKLNEDEHDR